MSGYPAHYTYDPLLATGGHFQQGLATVHTTKSSLITHCFLLPFFFFKFISYILFFSFVPSAPPQPYDLFSISRPPLAVSAVTAIHITHYPGAASSLLSGVDKYVVLA